MGDETERPTSDPVPSAEPGRRKPWQRPQLTVLPLDQTAASHFPGTDGGGTNTSSPAS